VLGEYLVDQRLIPDSSPTSFLPELLEYPGVQAAMPGEDKAFVAGRRIEQGDHSLQNLKPIVEWKSPRSKGRVARNDEDDVADALRLALDAKTDRAAVSGLLGLRGVSADRVRDIDSNLSGSVHRHRLSRP
jgi:hypothetical protein